MKLYEFLTYFLDQLTIGLKVNQIPFFGVEKPAPIFISSGISVFSHGWTSNVVNNSDKANFISISANRFPIHIILYILIISYYMKQYKQKI